MNKIKYLFFLLIGLTIISCQAPTKTELLSIKFETDLSGILKANKHFEKDQDVNLGLIAYHTNKPDQFTLNGIQLNTYTFPNGNVADYNKLSLFVTGKDKNNYLGFSFISVDQEETKTIIMNLKKTYPNYEQRDTKGSGESYFWDLQNHNAWLFMFQGISNDKNEKKFFTTNFVFIKKGTRMENSFDPKTIAIKEYYDMMYPDVVIN